MFRDEFNDFTVFLKKFNQLDFDSRELLCQEILGESYDPEYSQNFAAVICEEIWRDNVEVKFINDVFSQLSA